MIITVGTGNRRKDVNLTNVEEIEWAYRDDEPHGAVVRYTSGEKWFVGKDYVPELHGKVRAWQRTLEQQRR